MKDYIVMVQDLLNGRNEEFDNADKRRIRLIRHADNRKEKIINGKSYANSLYNLYLTEHNVFLTYQSEQIAKDFKDVDYMVSFIGEEGTTSRFVGVFKNGGIVAPLGLYNGKELARFGFTEVDGFELLKERVIIDWNNPVSWRQNYQNQMPVIRIDRGLQENNIPVFTRFEDVMLDYSQLRRIIETNNMEWKSKLESCNAVYLILDKLTGKQYVGSTYNPKGIWGRWSAYAWTGHGDNKDIKQLIDNDEKYAKKYFQWCILETLPLNILEKHAIDRESLYKQKFGTREFGYNNN